MPIIRKVLDVGPTSKAVVLPKSWLEFYENKTGQKILEVAIEVNGKLTITPYFKKALSVKEATP